jgi:hypothetical protein
MFIQIKDGAPTGNAVVEENLRAIFPQHNFPSLFIPSDVEPFGFGIYEFTQVPEVKYPHKLIEITPTLRENGIWYQTWGQMEMTQVEKEEATANQAKIVRNDRTYRLAVCDWTQGVDAPLTQEQKTLWATYRQVLRDITTQAGFPWAIDWPVQP